MKGKGLLIAAVGLVPALVGVVAFVLARPSYGTTSAVMAGGFIALFMPIVAVILLLPKLMGPPPE